MTDKNRCAPRRFAVEFQNMRDTNFQRGWNALRTEEGEAMFHSLFNHTSMRGPLAFHSYRAAVQTWMYVPCHTARSTGVQVLSFRLYIFVLIFFL